jgi:ankyrin repeat protein
MTQLSKIDRVYKLNRNIFAILLIFWPLGLFSVFLLDDPTVSGFIDILRHYVVFSAFLYPLYFLASLLLAKKALVNNKPITTVRLYGYIPLLSGLPWFLLGLGISFIPLSYDALKNTTGLPNNIFEQKITDTFSDKNLIALSIAAQNGDIETIQNICTPDRVNKMGHLAPYTPVVFGLKNIDGFTALLNCGANPNISLFNKDVSIMSLVTAMKDENFLKKAVKYGGNPNIKYKRWIVEEPILFLAATVSPERMNLLISLGANINETDEIGNTLIMNLIIKSEFKRAYQILKSGANIDNVNQHGETLKTILLSRMENLDKTHDKYQWASRILNELNE